MAQKVKKACRVCCNVYEACRSLKPNTGVFVWQEVACSPECGAAYLKRIVDSRSPSEPAPPEPKWRKRKAKTEPVVVEEATEVASGYTFVETDEISDLIVGDELIF